MHTGEETWWRWSKLFFRAGVWSGGQHNNQLRNRLYNDQCHCPFVRKSICASRYPSIHLSQSQTPKYHSTYHHPHLLPHYQITLITTFITVILTTIIINTFTIIYNKVLQVIKQDIFNDDLCVNSTCVPGVSDSAHKGFTITPNINYKCPRSVAAIALPVAAMALPQPPIYLKPT